MTASATNDSIGQENPGLRDISAAQWKSGLAAWLGWLFDGLDMHLYTLVAAPFVATLLAVSDANDPRVRWYGSWIQAAFLLGWALGGGFFGRLGDRLGRSRALCADDPDLRPLHRALGGRADLVAPADLPVPGRAGDRRRVGRRRLAALGDLAATVAAVAGGGAPVGGECRHPAGRRSPRSCWRASNPRLVFLVGVLPAWLVFWIRREVPEPAEWTEAAATAGARPPSIADLFRPGLRRTSILVILDLLDVADGALGLHVLVDQLHLGNLPDLAGWSGEDRRRLVSVAMVLVMARLDRGQLRRRRAGPPPRRSPDDRADVPGLLRSRWSATYGVPRDHAGLMVLLPVISVFSGLFALFTMYLPPLFPTLLRTTGAGFCYNIGRIASAVGTVAFGVLSTVSDYRTALIAAGCLFVPAGLLALALPELDDGDEPRRVAFENPVDPTSIP